MTKHDESTLLRTAESDEAYSPHVDIARKLQIGRKKRGMTQRDLAKLMAVSPGAVAQWETGQTRPTILNRVDLARVLAIPFAELLPESELSEHQMSISDPQTMALVKHYQKLSPRLREMHLMFVAASAGDEDQPDTPAKSPSRK